VASHAFLHASETRWVRGRPAVVLAHVDVDERRAGLERLMRGLDLLVGGTVTRRFL
jgi:hypothetical protein